MTTPNVNLSKEEVARYGRHLILPEVGMDGQKKLKAAKVLIVGAGGLGSPIGLYLAAAGVGTIGIVDFDVVDESNLQRQVIYTTNDVGRSKVDRARRRLLDLNPNVNVIPYEEPLSSENALSIMEDYDMVVDGTDNFATRYLVNDACTLLGIPNVYGSIFRFEGQVSVFCHPEGPSYRCVYPEPPPPGLVPSCAEGGVLGVLPGVVGCLQANEAIKLITGIGDPLIGRLLRFDALTMKFFELIVRRDPEWPIGEPHPTVTELIDYEEFCGAPLREEPAEQTASADSDDPFGIINVEQLSERIKGSGDDFVLIDVREPHEYDIASIPTAKLIPLSTFDQGYSAIENNGKDILIHCHHGGRSARACEFLASKGYKNLFNVAGGIHEWSEKVDPEVPQY